MSLLQAPDLHRDNRCSVGFFGASLALRSVHREEVNTSKCQGLDSLGVWRWAVCGQIGFARTASSRKARRKRKMKHDNKKLQPRQTCSDRLCVYRKASLSASLQLFFSSRVMTLRKLQECTLQAGLEHVPDVRSYLNQSSQCLSSRSKMPPPKDGFMSAGGPRGPPGRRPKTSWRCRRCRPGRLDGPASVNGWLSAS